MIDIDNNYEDRFVLMISGVVLDMDKTAIKIDNFGNIINVRMIFRSDLDKVQIGQEIKIYIELNEFSVSSNTVKWYGFFDKNVRNFISQFEGVSGIGRMGAASIYESLLVNGMSMKDICDEISVGNVELFCKVPGIGEKSAQRIVNSLKNTITYPETYEINTDVSVNNSQVNEAVEILFSLGFVKSDVDNVISRLVIDNTITAMEIVDKAVEMLNV